MPYLDCLAAAKHFLSAEVLSEYSVDPERVAVSGDSAGGNLAAAVAQEVLILHSIVTYDHYVHRHQTDLFCVHRSPKTPV